MAALSRYTQKIFAVNNASSQQLNEFGSVANGGVQYSAVPSDIQTTYWEDGWLNAVIANTTKRLPVYQDMNSVHYVLSYQIAYIFQEGIGVWDSGTEYRTNSVVKQNGTSQLFISLQDSNENNALTEEAWWQQCGDLRYIPSAPIEGLFANENILINGQFNIDQQVVGGGTAISDDGYCVDQWYVLTQTASIQISTQALQADGIASNIRLTQNQASAQRMGIAQIVLGSRSQNYRGANLTESIMIRCSSSQAIRYAILEWTGTVNTVTSDVVNDWTSSTYTAGNFFLGSNLTVSGVGTITPGANTWTAIDALTAAISSSCNNLIVFIWTEGTAAQNVTLDIGNFKLENGSYATPYPYQDKDEELIRCLPFFERIHAKDSVTYIKATGYSQSATLAYIPVFCWEKWKVPTVSFSSNTGFAFTNASGNYTSTSMSASGLNRTGIRVDLTTTGIGGANLPGVLDINAGNYIDVNSRL